MAINLTSMLAARDIADLFWHVENASVHVWTWEEKMDKKLSLVAVLRAKPGTEAELGSRLLALVEPSRAG